MSALKSEEAKKYEYIPVKAKKLNSKIYTERDSFEPVIERL
tara:strand:+ start:384 stop:506 length:123 start_codon:yes stop_codon:yes gene_type:complete